MFSFAQVVDWGVVWVELCGSDCGQGLRRGGVVGRAVIDLACFQVQVGHGFFEVLAQDVIGAAHAHVGVEVVVSGLLLQAALFYPTSHQEV